MFLAARVEEKVVQKKVRALAAVSQWIERLTVNQRVARAIPSQGTGLGCGPGPP